MSSDLATTLEEEEEEEEEEESSSVDSDAPKGERIVETKKNKKNKRNFRCRTCNKPFSQRSDLNRHMVVHTGIKSHKCHLCEKEFTLKTNLSAHMVTHTGIRVYRCGGNCTEEFTDKEALTAHREIHAGERTHKCDYCGRAFTKSSNLFRHMDIHSGVRNFQCPRCPKSFFQKTDLTRHTSAVHSGIKGFSCPTCGKEFSLKSNLTKHLPVHTGDKSHKCHVCNKAFFRKSSLASHLMVHIFPKNSSAAAALTAAESHLDAADNSSRTGADERLATSSSSGRYWCDLCGKEFNRKSSLVRHHVVHSGERNFRCQLCGKEFNRKSILLRHMDVHADAKNIRCAICGKEFNQKSNMDRHMAVHFKPHVSHEPMSQESSRTVLAGCPVERIRDIRDRLLVQTIRNTLPAEDRGEEQLALESHVATHSGVCSIGEVGEILSHGKRTKREEERLSSVGVTTTFSTTSSSSSSLILNLHQLLNERGEGTNGCVPPTGDDDDDDASLSRTSLRTGGFKGQLRDGSQRGRETQSSMWTSSGRQDSAGDWLVPLGGGRLEGLKPVEGRGGSLLTSDAKENSSLHLQQLHQMLLLGKKEGQVLLPRPETVPPAFLSLVEGNNGYSPPPPRITVETVGMATLGLSKSTFGLHYPEIKSECIGPRTDPKVLGQIHESSDGSRSPWTDP